MKKIVKTRKKDFKSLFLMTDKDSYVFTPDRKPDQILRPETITIDVNKVIQSVSNRLSDKLTIISHSFRIGYISQLWKDTSDIKFVRQAISKTDTTSQYVKNLSEDERRERMKSVGSKDLN